MNTYVERISEDAPGMTLENLAGHEASKKFFNTLMQEDPSIDQMLGINSMNAFIIVGPSGAGKTAFANAMAGSLSEGGYHFFGIHVDESGFLSNNLCEKIQTQLEFENCVVLFHEIEKLRDAEAIYNLFMADVDHSLVMIAYSSSIEQLCDGVSFYFQPVYLCKPTQLDRKHLFQEELPGGESMEEAIVDLSKKTDGYGYAELVSLTTQFKLRLKKEIIANRLTIDLEDDLVKYVDSVLEDFRKPSEKEAVVQVVSGISATASPQKTVSEGIVSTQGKDMVEGMPQRKELTRNANGHFDFSQLPRPR